MGSAFDISCCVSKLVKVFLRRNSSIHTELTRHQGRRLKIYNECLAVRVGHSFLLQHDLIAPGIKLILNQILTGLGVYPCYHKELAFYSCPCPCPCYQQCVNWNDATVEMTSLG